MPISTINQNGLTNPLTSVAANTVTSAAATALTLQSAGTTAVTINTSQQVGIGTASPTVKLDVTGNLKVTNSSGSTIVANRTSNPGSIELQHSGVQTAQFSATSGGGLEIYTGSSPTERMRIDSSGNLLVGSTSASASPVTKGFQVTSGGSNISVFDNTDGLGFSSTSNTKSIGMSAGITYGGGAGNSWIKLNPTTGSSASIVMQANSNGVILNNNATAWASNSDLRLKNVIGNYENALVDIAQIEPVKFTWKADKENQPQVGVIAQSVENIVPEAISKTKSIEGDDTEYLQVRYTELIPLMIASIQELKAEFDAYKASHP
jgi:hypothetical protein